MTDPANNSALAQATDAPALPHQEQLISAKMPAWMSSTSATIHGQMRAATRTPVPWFEDACLRHPDITRLLSEEFGIHRSAEASVKALLAPLPELEQFAARQLTQAIKQRFGLELDVNNTYLFNGSKAAAYKLGMNGDLIVFTQSAMKLATQSL